MQNGSSNGVNAPFERAVNAEGEDTMTTTGETVQLHPDMEGRTVNPAHADIVCKSELGATNILVLNVAVDIPPQSETKEYERPHGHWTVRTRSRQV